ncbi:MAG: hypothetical protein FJ398_14280 [Verrucomicrobia bacterium]|nr:hypothetical protein [Verrucomicrobiota bacterium]
MVRRLLQFAVVASLVFVVGVHWILLQSVAWTGMIIVYSQTASLREAIIKTFDGQHPCQLCKAVQEGRAAEQKQRPQRKLSAKVDFFCNHDPVVIETPPPFQQPISQSVHFPTRTEAPLGPPPRLA